MARALKVFRTHLGFFDTVVAVPSRAAALKAWGLSSDEFRTGFASETKDATAVRSALAKPGVVLYRAFGSGEAYSERRTLPKGMKPPRETKKAEAEPATRRNEKAERKIAKTHATVAASERRARVQQKKHEAAEARRAALEEKERKNEARAERQRAAELERAETRLKKKLDAISEKEEELRQAREAAEAEFERLRARIS